MKKLITILLLLIASTFIFSQNTHKYSNFYYQRKSLFQQLPIKSTDIIFVGNSITNGAEWSELFENPNIKNRGISGDISQGVYDRLDDIIKGKPKKIFLLVGINDIALNIPTNTIYTNIEKIISKIKINSKQTQIYLQSVLPTNPDIKNFPNHKKPEKIKDLNEKIKFLAKKHNINYIDLYSHFIIKNTDILNPKYTNDGLHLMGEGYILWKNLIAQHLK